MRPAILLLLTAMTTMLHGQVSIEKLESLVKKNRSFNEIRKALKGKENVFLHTDIERNIDGGHQQLLIRKYDYPTLFEILLQRSDKKIYLAVINEVTYKPKSDTPDRKNVLYHFDSFLLHQYIHLHDSIYGSALTPARFMDFTVYQYGMACGADGNATPECRKMKEFVARADTASLGKWLSHYDYETKIVGALGLLLLREKGISLHYNVAGIIDHLRRLNTGVNACFGCLFSGAAPVQQLLSEQSILMCKEYMPEEFTPSQMK